MAHNSYIRGSIGAWATGTQVSQAEFWQMDQYLYGAINGDAGGTWAPATAITLGGTAGLVLGFGTPLTVGGTVTMSSTANANILNALTMTVTGDVDFGSSATDALTVTSTSTFVSPVIFSALTTHNATADFNAAATFDSTATFNGTTTATAAVALTGTATLDTASTVTSTMAGSNLMGSTPGSAGKATKMVGDLTSDGNGGRVAFSTINFGNTDLATGYHYRYIGTPSILRTLSLTLGTPRAGTEFHVHNFGSAVLDVHIGGGLFTSLTAASSATIFYDGSNWFRAP